MRYIIAVIKKWCTKCTFGLQTSSLQKDSWCTIAVKWCTIGAPFYSDGSPAIYQPFSGLRCKGALGAPFFYHRYECTANQSLSGKAQDAMFKKLPEIAEVASLDKEERLKSSG